MQEIATIIFTGLCLFAPAPGGSPFRFTAYLFHHDPQTAASVYSSIPMHIGYVKVPANEVLPETKRNGVPSTKGKYAVFYLDPSEKISFKGIEDVALTAPTSGLGKDERPFAVIPAYTEICDEKDCGTMSPSHGAQIDVDRGVLLARSDYVQRLDWRFCTHDEKHCSPKTIKNDILPRAAVLHVHGGGKSLEVCSGTCGSANSIWIRAGARIIIGSGIKPEVEQDGNLTHTAAYRSADTHFELYYTTRPKAPLTKHYIPIDSKKTYPEGSNCPPLRY